MQDRIRRGVGRTSPSANMDCPMQEYVTSRIIPIRDQCADVLQSMVQKKEWARGRTRRSPKKRPRNKHILPWVGGVGESERLEKIDGPITN